MDTLQTLPDEFWAPLWLTLQLALVTSAILLAIGIPLARWLNASRFPGIVVIESLVALPIVLPPTVIGFYLLVALSPRHTLGQWWQQLFGHSLAFSFAGLVIGSVIYSLPFAVQPLQAAFRNVSPALIEASAALGATASQTFWRVVAPASLSGILTAASLSFAHTMGEFGVVLMIGGNIQGETRVASIALYDNTQALNFAHAHRYAIVLLVISLAMLVAVTLLQRRASRDAPR